MKAKILIIVLVLASLLLGSCASPSPETTTSSPVANPEKPKEEPKESVEPIKVGILLPLTGQDALNGQTSQYAFDMAVEEINEAGGIKCLGGAPLQLIYGDTKGSPEAGNAETERLITKDNVIALQGAFHSDVVLSTTEISEKYEIPYLVPNSIMGLITERGLKYVFKTRIALGSQAETNMKFASEQGAKRVASLTPNSAIGREARDAYKEFASKYGLELLDQIEFPIGTQDFSDSLLRLKSLDLDVIFAEGDTTDDILMVRQMRDLNIWPKMTVMTTGGGWGDGSLLTNLKELSYGITNTTDWSPAVEGFGGDEINARFEERFNTPMTGGMTPSYATTFVLAAALEKSCSRDPKQLAEVLRTTHFKEGKWNFIFPQGVSFDEKGYINDPRIIIVQFLDEQQMPVSPPDVATTELIWPVPSWENR